MAQKRYEEEQIVPMLRRADVELGQGKKVPEVCQLLGISQQTYYRWRQKYGDREGFGTARLSGPRPVSHHAALSIGAIGC